MTLIYVDRAGEMGTRMTRIYADQRPRNILVHPNNPENLGKKILVNPGCSEIRAIMIILKIKVQLQQAGRPALLQHPGPLEFVELWVLGL